MFKNIFKIFAASVLASFFVFVFTANAQAEENISSYLTDITINQDSSINVVETITYDFGEDQRHGIFRDIPYKYKARGGTFKLRISDVSVKNEKEADINFEKSTSGGEVHLKIGDADEYVTGQNTYKISYTVKRAVNYFDTHDELYWNAIGTGWTVPIIKGEAIIRGPEAITQTECFTGAPGSNEKRCTISGGNTNIVTIGSIDSIAAGEGLTVVVGMRAGALEQPTTAQKFWDIFIDNGILLLPFLVFLIMYFLWYKYGRDAKNKNSIVAQYDAPDNLSAMYAGSLIHNNTTDKDIAAEVIWLAAHGYITIQRIETKKMLVFKGQDYEFFRTDKTPNGLPAQTAALLYDLFTGGKTTSKLSELKTDRTFGSSLVKIKSEVMKELVKSNYYKANPTTVMALWFGLGLLGTFLTAMLLGNLIGFLGVLSAIVSGAIVIGFSFIMPARTQKGADAAAHIKGLEQYLTVAEKDRLNFHNAPEKSPQVFEMLLPFAIALGVERAWASQFQDLNKAPSWYNDSTGAAFNAGFFAGSMNHFSDSMQSTAKSAMATSAGGGSGFSGGGSGGGGGGGGGGSW